LKLQLANSAFIETQCGVRTRHL